MNERERSIYDERMQGLLSKYHRMKNWRKLLGSALRYKRPFLANAEALLIGNEDVNIAKMDEELYPSDSESDFGSGTDSDRESEEPDSPGDSTDRIAYKRRSTASLVSPTKGRKVKDKGKMNMQLYVMPCFLKPGKQTFIVQSQMFHEDIDEAHNQSSNYGTPDHRFGHQESTVTEMRTEDADLTPQYFFHQAVAPHRREKVPLCKYSLIF